MAQSPRRLDLRLTIPAAAPFHAVAAELAEKFAEYAGAQAAAARDLGQAVESFITEVADGSPDAAVKVEMLAGDLELVVTVNSRSTGKLTCPLPD